MLAYLKSAIGIATLLTIAALTAWGMRVDSLRGGYKAKLEAVVLAVVDIGEPKPSFDKLPDTVHKIDGDRKALRKERDDALAVVDLQSSSITKLEQEGIEAAERAAANRKLFEETKRQRDAWIQRARAAETRTERLSAEEELRECEAVLDSLRLRGF
ncbi:hypothetical protein [Sphingopyxis terrae]|uniref:hypothetical protein n=1 Tax=Sphingopyxis terrae TaxID=33052 RepID=UPI00078780F8|nr:hypothetical protein [Sphingopyxis terrae]